MARAQSARGRTGPDTLVLEGTDLEAAADLTIGPGEYGAAPAWFAGVFVSQLYCQQDAFGDVQVVDAPICLHLDPGVVIVQIEAMQVAAVEIDEPACGDRFERTCEAQKSG